MPERLKQIPIKLQEIWKKYTAKQRAIIISTMAVVVLALIVLIVVLNQTEYEKLVEFDNTATAKSAMAILDENSIENRLASDNKTVEVNKKQKQPRNVLKKKKRFVKLKKKLIFVVMLLL